MTNKEYAAGLLIEAADLLNNESAGANGALKRYYEEMGKGVNKKAADVKSKYDQYKKAGYDDSPKAKNLKLDYETRKGIADEIKDGEREADTKDRSKSIGARKFDAYMSKKMISHHTSHNKLNNKSAAIHDRINKRAGMHESVSFEMLEN